MIDITEVWSRLFINFCLLASLDSLNTAYYFCSTHPHARLYFPLLV